MLKAARITLLVAGLAAFVALTGCKEEGTMESAGKKLDQATTQAEGAAKDAAKKVDAAAEDASKTLDDALNK
jgi:uncharacterized protein (UPF0333 family)